MDLPANTEVCSFQYFGNTRDPLASVVITTDVSFLDNKEFYDADAYTDADNWTDSEIEAAFGEHNSKPYIMIDGKRVWPEKFTNTDPNTLVSMVLYPSTDDRAWISISLQKHMVGFDVLVRDSIASQKRE